MLSVGEFAEITRTNAETLRYYDRIGLLSPVHRDENSYRYYSVDQLSVCNAIRILRKLDISLEEIKGLLISRTPKYVKDVLLRQIDDIKNKRGQLDRIEQLLHMALENTEMGLDADTEAITVQDMPARQIILGDPNDYSGGRTDYDALRDFYKATAKKYTLSEYEICCPVWGMFSEQQIRSGDFVFPGRYYYDNPNGPDQRPAATYAVGHTHTGYGGGVELIKRMIAYINENGYEICGNTYLEYLINELGEPDSSNYLLRGLISVRKAQR
jgi:DNA-binding transcriptional MerR regulator